MEDIKHAKKFKYGKPLLVLCLLSAWFAFHGARPAYAQDGPETGTHELQVWTGGGTALNGIESNSNFWNLGLRYGWVLTDPRGPGFLRGRFEYAVDVIPAFMVFRRNETAYGFSIDPFAVKWILDTHRRIAPYFELSGGALFTDKEIPLQTSRVNFTTSGALGIHVLAAKLAWSGEVRFVHISNANLAPNPGFNTLQLRVGIGKFTHHRF